eukprot:gene10486-12207_t
MTNLKKYIDLSLDFSFKKIFGTEPNKDLLISFLNEVFKGRKHIIDLVYNKNEHHGENKEEASAVFDLLCTGNRGEKFLIEVQHSNPVNFKKRALYYTSRLVSEQAPKGNIREWKYDVTEIYFVAVLEKLEKELSGELRYFHDICLCYRETGEVFYEGLAYIYIDLSKFVKKEAELETGLDIWLWKSYLNTGCNLKDWLNPDVGSRNLKINRALAMNHKEKQAALEKYKAIAIATLDYLIKNYTGKLVFDQYDPHVMVYSTQKEQVERYFKQRKLDQLKRHSTKFQSILLHNLDVKFKDFIKEQTGYEIDIFKDLQDRIEAIVASKEITTDRELYDVRLMSGIYEKTSGDQKKLAVLQNLVVAFTDKIPVERSSKVISEQKYKEMRRRSGFLLDLASPDKKNRLELYTNGKDGYAQTSVNVYLKDGHGGPVYTAKGQSLPIKTYWKDNRTVVIETKKTYEVTTRYEKLSSLKNVIRIEYTED